MTHTGSNRTAISRDRATSSSSRPRRAVAEIELLLTVLILAVLMLMTVAAIKLALARLDTAQAASVEAMSRAAGNPATTDDTPVSPTEGYTTIRPGLPLRGHGPRIVQDVPALRDTPGNQSQSSSYDVISISATSWSSSPAWPYTADPIGGADAASNQQWFLNYFNDTHGQVAPTLQLSPAWPP